MTHVAICRQNNKSGWVTLHKQGGDQWQLVGTSGAGLEHVISAFLEETRKSYLRGDFTFSDRRLEQIVATPTPETPEDLQSLVGASISVLAPEGRQGDATTWGSAWLDPTGHMSSPGIAGRYRAKTIADQLERWFQREDFRSFEPPHHRENMSPHRISRPAHNREVLVRHSWRLRDLVPDVFSSAEVAAEKQKQLAAAAAAHAERRRLNDPRLKRQARQAEWAAEREARKVDPVAAEADRKARYGLDWGTKPPDAA